MMMKIKSCRITRFSGVHPLGTVNITSFMSVHLYVINIFHPKQQMSTSEYCARKCQQVKVIELLSVGTMNVWTQICGDQSNRSWGDVSANEGNWSFVLICAISMRGQILVTAQTTVPSTALRAACLTWLCEGLHLMWWKSSWRFWHRGIISQVSERLRLNGPSVSVRINEFAFVSAYVSILCVPLILGMLAYSSNQADVRDLFWMPAATAGQQQQQQQGEGMPSVRRPGQSDRWSCRRKRRWRLSCFMGCGGEREREEWGEKGGVGLGTWHSWERRGRVVEVVVVVEVGVGWGGVGGLKAFGLVPVEPAFWHAAFQEINTTVFPFTPQPTSTHPAAHPELQHQFFFFNKSLLNTVESSIAWVWWSSYCTPKVWYSIHPGLIEWTAVSFKGRQNLFGFGEKKYSSSLWSRAAANN